MAADEHIESGVHHHEAGAHEHKADGGDGSSLLSAAALVGVGAIVESDLLVGIALGAGAVLGLRAIWTSFMSLHGPAFEEEVAAAEASAELLAWWLISRRSPVRRIAGRGTRRRVRAYLNALTWLSGLERKCWTFLAERFGSLA